VNSERRGDIEGGEIDQKEDNEIIVTHLLRGLECFHESREKSMENGRREGLGARRGQEGRQMGELGIPRGPLMGKGEGKSRKKLA